MNGWIMATDRYLDGIGPSTNRSM